MSESRARLAVSLAAPERGGELVAREWEVEQVFEDLMLRGRVGLMDCRRMCQWLWETVDVYVAWLVSVFSRSRS